MTIIDDIDDRRRSLTTLTINDIDNRSQWMNDSECQCNRRSNILKIEIESGRLLQ